MSPNFLLPGWSFLIRKKCRDFRKREHFPKGSGGLLFARGEEREKAGENKGRISRQGMRASRSKKEEGGGVSFGCGSEAEKRTRSNHGEGIRCREIEKKKKKGLIGFEQENQAKNS